MTCWEHKERDRDRQTYVRGDGREIKIDRLICWEDKERDRQTYVKGDGREIETDRLTCWEDNDRDRDRQREVGGGREKQTDRC